MVRGQRRIDESGIVVPAPASALNMMAVVFHHSHSKVSGVVEPDRLLNSRRGQYIKVVSGGSIIVEVIESERVPQVRWIKPFHCRRA